MIRLLILFHQGFFSLFSRDAALITPAATGISLLLKDCTQPISFRHMRIGK